ncbi:ATP-binding protein [Streptomyces sp. LE64]|uniref:ATP-binding protein n=1 Tax=Streptomyces sp. LE64 TaxID=3448653 RepID=UPI0040421E8A
MSRPTTGDFGQRLRELRARAGLSQERLAHQAGLSVRALADLERGRTTGPQRRTVELVTRALGLGADEAADLEAAAAAGRPRSAPGPATPGPLLSLPRDTHDFTARGHHLTDLRALATAADPAYPPVAVVAGQPGLGKTAFATRAAHLLAPLFPDGRLWLDLRGMDAEPVRPGDALARLLRALGVADRSQPREPEERAELFRSLAAGRRLLVVLDNAVDEQQVRPLLPGSGTCFTVVTSRNCLSGLEGVHRVDLPLLRREEAVELLTRILGPERVEREAQAARDLADLCGHLPLALRIAGQRLAARPHESLTKLADRLRRQERRLDTLRAGDLQVRAVFALSYHQLDPVARLLLRRCALAAGPDVSPATAALLAGVPLDDAELHLEALADRGLLQTAPTVERYRFHDLLKLFAAERTAAEDDPATRDAALDRTARWTLARATAAALHFDAERHATGDPDPATAPVGREEARAWLEAERAQWLAALQRARTTGDHRQVLDAAEAMHWFSDLTKHWHQWVEVFGRAVDAARALESRQEEATHLNYLAWAHNTCAHDARAALDTARSALAVARECDDLYQTGWALVYGASALRRMDRNGEAVTWLRESVDCLRRDPSSRGRLAELTALNALGITLRERGRADQALDIHRRGVDICTRGIPGQDPHLLALYRGVTLQHVGNDYAALDRWPEAEAPLRQCLAIFEEADMPAWSGPAGLDLGRVLRRLDRGEEARAVLTSALDILSAHHHPRQAEAAAELDAFDSTPR